MESVSERMCLVITRVRADVGLVTPENTRIPASGRRVVDLNLLLRRPPQWLTQTLVQNGTERK